MSTWTPPVIIGRSTHVADEALFERLGLGTDDRHLAATGLAEAKIKARPMLVSRRTTRQKTTDNHWMLTRGADASAPLRLARSDNVHLSVDFTTGKAHHRSTESGKGAQALSKALGVKGYYRTYDRHPMIIDATGGLGQDAWALASIGCHVIIIEHHPIIHALLHDGLRRALNATTSISTDLTESDPAVSGVPDTDLLARQLKAHATEDVKTARRITLMHGDAVEYLCALCESHKIHAIYLDPMYPQRRKRAASKKGMQFLHALLGPPADKESPELLLCALECNVSRVAVKRPAGAPALAGSEHFVGQRTVIKTTNTRYDVYHQL